MLLDQCIRPPGVVKSPTDNVGGPFVLLISVRVGRCAGDHRPSAVLLPASLSNTSELVPGDVSGADY